MTRYKNQVKELEEREDELMKEKRQQAKEVCVCERVCDSVSEDGVLTTLYIFVNIRFVASNQKAKIKKQKLIY